MLVSLAALASVSRVHVCKEGVKNHIFITKSCFCISNQNKLTKDSAKIRANSQNVSLVFVRKEQ
jgi:hypothetical protein